MGDAESQRGNHSYDSFGDKQTRHAFIRKTLAIVAVQLLVTFLFVLLVMTNDDVRMFLQARKNGWIFYVCIGLSSITWLLFAYFQCARKKFPINIILLTIFTLAESYMIGKLCSYAYADVVLLAFGITVVVCSALILFACQSKWDFTGFGPFMIIFMVILIVMGIVSIFWRNRIFLIIYCSVGILIFSVYLIIDIQMMLGGKHKYQYDPEDWVMAAISIYTDIISMFIYILTLTGLLSDG